MANSIALEAVGQAEAIKIVSRSVSIMEMTSSDRRIFVRQKRTENGENENLPRILYGVRKRGDLLYFAVSVPEAKECILKLYRDNEQIFIVHMTERIGTLFFTVVNNQALQADSYQLQHICLLNRSLLQKIHRIPYKALIKLH